MFESKEHISRDVPAKSRLSAYLHSLKICIIIRYPFLSNMNFFIGKDL